MTPLAVAVLAHADVAHFRRLIAALPDTPVVVHCDARSADDVYAGMTADAPARVRFVRRRRTTLASWSLVLAELEALREAVRWTDARHIAVLSGADYPLLPMGELLAELDRWAGRTWMSNTPLPHRDWDTPRHRDGGLWRLRYRYLTRRDQVLFWRSYPLRLPVPRAVPADLAPRAASQWKIYDREHVRGLLRVADERPDLLAFWRTTLIPEESFAASMLASPRLFGASALPPYRPGAWYLDWNNENAGHPRWLTGSDFDRLAAARRAAPTGPDTGAGAGEDDGRKLFARKFRSADAAVLDRIDAELRR